MDEIRDTYENDENYIILDKQIHPLTFSKWPKLKKVDFEAYSSDKVKCLEKDELKQIIKKEFDL